MLTVPSKAARPVLELRAFRLGVVSRTEILDHEIYYDRTCLDLLLEDPGFSLRVHRYFQLGMNNVLVATPGETLPTKRVLPVPSSQSHYIQKPCTAKEQ